MAVQLHAEYEVYTQIHQLLSLDNEFHGFFLKIVLPKNLPNPSIQIFLLLTINKFN